jgi:hypothetical protein
MLGADFGKSPSTPHIAGVTETHYPTGMGMTLVERDITTDKTIMVLLPGGMREIHGNTKLLSIKRNEPPQARPGNRAVKAPVRG